MTAAELFANAIHHEMCQAGLDYIQGKSLQDILDDNTSSAADTIFWLCCKNAGCPGWPTDDKILPVLAQVMLIAEEFVGIMVPILTEEYKVAEKKTTPLILLAIYFGLETHIIWQDGLRMQEFKDKIAPTVKKLRPSI